MDGENRLYRILTIIEKNNVTTLKAIADKLKVGTKTIKNEIKELNRLLYQHALIEIKDHQYKLYILNDEQYDAIKHKLSLQNSSFNSQQNRMAHIFYALINCHHYCLTDDLIEDLNIGRSSFMNDLKELRTKLKGYDITIIGKTNKGLSIKGNQMNIRLFLLNEVYSLIYPEYVFPKEIYEIVQAMNISFFSNLETRAYFFKFLTVAIDRIEHEDSLCELYSTYQRLKHNSIYPFVSQLMDTIGHVLDISFNEFEKIFMTIPLVSMRTPIHKQTKDNMLIPKETTLLVNSILSFIKLKFNIQLFPGKFLEEFQYHLFFMMNRIQYGIKINNPILEDIQEKYSLAYTMAESINELLSGTLHQPIPEEEIGYIAMYLGLFLSENMHHSDKIYKVALISGNGILSARVIESQIRNVFSTEISIDILSENEVQVEYMKQYHLVFSIVKLQVKLNIPIIYIKEIFDEVEFRKKLEYIKYTNNLDIPIKRGIHSILLNILEKDHFFILDDVKTYDENLEYMTTKLVNKNYVDHNFYERLKEREHLATMIFDHNIAIPHDVNYKTSKVIFALGVLPNELKVQANKSVKLIFLLGIPDEANIYEKLIVRIYNEIISIAKDQTKVNDISKIRTYDEFVHYMIRQHNVI